MDRVLIFLKTYWNNILTILIMVYLFFQKLIKEILLFFNVNLGFSTVFGAFITLLGTVGAMIWVDNQNKRRWMKDGVVKQYISNLIEARQSIIETNNVIRNFFNSIKMKDFYIYYQKDFYLVMNSLYKTLDSICTMSSNNIKDKYDKIIDFKQDVFHLESFFREIDLLCWSKFKKYEANRNSLKSYDLEIDENLAKVRFTEETLKEFDKIVGTHILTKNTDILVNNLNSIKSFINDYFKKSEECCDVIDKLLSSKDFDKFII